MVDYAKCANKECGIKEHCYRYTAKASKTQGYIQVKDWRNCVAFLANKPDVIFTNYSELIISDKVIGTAKGITVVR